MGRPDLVVVSNRGPVSFRRDGDGELVACRGGGGLASSLAPLLEGSGATWIAAAMSDDDRAALDAGVSEVNGMQLRSLSFDDEIYAKAYDVVSNATLWFLHHGLFDLARRPRIDRRWHDAWDAYRSFNETFARAVCDEAPDGATVLVQDYHLALVGTHLAAARPDLRTVHFSHTPFCDPMTLRVLPDSARRELLEGMAAHGSCGFHSSRWATNYRACAQEALGRDVPTFVAPLAPDPSELVAVAEGAECAAEQRWLDDVAGGCRLIVRVDRIELSKNILRGFLAFDELLETHSEWRGAVAFVALVYPSRGGLPEYLSYRAEVDSIVEHVNARWRTKSWTPIVLDTEDNFPRSVAALQRYDVLLVNPVRDGLNLVAEEGPIVNTAAGVVALSTEAGAFDQLGNHAVGLNPFDVGGTAEALHAALSMSSTERGRRASALRETVLRRTPGDWLRDQIDEARQ